MEKVGNGMDLHRTVVFIALILLGISCNKSNHDNHKTDTIPDSIQPLVFVNEALDEDSRTFFSLEIIDHTTFYNGQPGEEIGQDSSIQKQDSLLLLPLSSGGYYKIQDTGDTDTDSYKIYRYEGEFNTIPCYLVSSEGYESYRMILVDKDNGARYEAYGKSVVSPKASYLVGTATYSEEAFVDDPYFRMELYFLSDNKINGKSQSVVIDMSKLRSHYESFPEDCYLSWENEEILLVSLIFESDGTRSKCYLRLTGL